MKRFIYVLCFQLAVAGSAFAEDFTTLDGERYADATLKRVEPDGLVISYADGVKKLKFTNLPSEICRKYGYNPDIAAKFLAQQQNASLNTPSATPSAYAQTSNTFNTSPTSAHLASNALSNALVSTSTISTSSLLIVQPIANSTSKIGLLENIFLILKAGFKIFKEWIKSFIIKSLHSLLPWAFRAPYVYYSSTTQISQPAPTEESSPAPTGSATPPPTPEQIIQSIIGKDPVPAEQLSSVLQKYPQFKNLQFFETHILISITGVVESFLICGIDNERVEIKFKTPVGFPNIYISYDLKRNDPDTYEEWKVNDLRLFIVTRNSRKTTSELFCAHDLPFKSSGPIRIKSITPSSLTFKMAR
jgi:hypothetical protein